MKFTLVLIPFLLLFPFRSGKKQAESIKKSTGNDPTSLTDSLKLKPIFGYRFVISGDFDGDGNSEKLIEHYFSKVSHSESPKFYENEMEYDQLVELTIAKEPFSFVLCDHAGIDTLHISENSQLFGISYLKNEGDLNGDGTDEVSYVVDWADWSNLNTWHIVSYKNKTWQEIYSFPIWDWQLPALPSSANVYGLFGTQDKIQIAETDSLSIQLEQDLKNFPGLVKKVGKNKIKISYRSDEAEELTKTVPLKKMK